MIKTTFSATISLKFSVVKRFGSKLNELFMLSEKNKKVRELEDEKLKLEKEIKK
jgi:hypothetical protein